MTKNLYQDYSQHLSYQNTDKEYQRYKNYFYRNYLKYLPKNKKAKILDLGCGPGLFLRFLADLGYQNISGIDLSPGNVKICQQRNLKVKQIDGFEYLPSREESFDLIVANDLLEHIRKDQVIDFLKLIRGALKNNGRLIVKTLNMSNAISLSTLYGDFTHQYGYTEKNLTQVARLANFSKIKLANLIIYPNIFLIDELITLIHRLLFFLQKLRFIFYGKIGYHIFSKHLLAILKK